MERDLYMYGLMEMVEMMMTVLLMAILPVYTPYPLELLELMVHTVTLMSDALQKWSLPM